MTASSIDYDMLMRANLTRVFGERDAAQRMKAVVELYTDDAVLYEPDAIASGHAAIDRAVDKLLSRLPKDFTFSPLGPAVGHHGLGRLRWQAGAPGGPVAVTGLDVAAIDGGQIKALYVFLDPPGA